MPELEQTTQPCPACPAAAGEPCRTDEGHAAPWVHQARTQAAVAYRRDVLVEVLVYHYRVAPGKGCGCGWSKLGASWPAHVAEVYEQSVVGRA